MAAAPVVDAAKLWEAVRSARLVLQPFRENRLHAIRQYAGNNYGENATSARTPLNLLALYNNVVGPNLISQNPKGFLSTTDKANRPSVATMQDVLNDKIEQMGVQETLAAAIMDALFWMGIVKVSLVLPGESQKGGYDIPAGDPFVDSVDPDDFVFDTNARRLSEASFIGHRFQIPMEVFKASKIYKKSLVKDAGAVEERKYNTEGGGDERVGNITSPDDSQELDEWDEQVELWEIYLPRKRLIVTLHADLGEALSVRKWVGPKCGPYHFLGLHKVPGQPNPKGPIQDLVDLHELANNLWCKLRDQAERQKTFGVVPGQAVDDANRLIDVNDGEMIRMDNGNLAKEISLGGINQTNFLFATAVKDNFTYLGGNLDSLGGLSPQSGTLGQDEMLSKNASRLIADMQAKVVKWVAGIYKSMAWYLWNDPFSTHRSSISLSGVEGLSVERKVTPQERQRVPFDELQVTIDPYSMRSETPQSKMASIDQVVMQIIMPMAPMLGQQGIQFDISAYLKLKAKLGNMPELEDLLTMAEPLEQSQPVQEPPGMPANTTRTYERVNRPGASRAGKDSALMQTLMGTAQPAEAASIMRPTS